MIIMRKLAGKSIIGGKVNSEEIRGGETYPGVFFVFIFVFVFVFVFIFVRFLSFFVFVFLFVFLFVQWLED